MDNYDKDKEFQRCVAFVLQQECRRNKDGSLDDGYTNDPNDPGGETKYGISKKAYPNLDIKNLTLGDALNLYYRDYWWVGSAEAFPLDVCVLDCAVNQGTKTAKGFLQNCEKDWQKFNFQREQHYLALLQGKFKDNPKRETYRKEWFQRIINLRKFIDIENARISSWT